MPLLDAAGNVLAVAKFVNRRRREADAWQPCFERLGERRCEGHWKETEGLWKVFAEVF